MPNDSVEVLMDVPVYRYLRLCHASWREITGTGDVMTILYNEEGLQPRLLLFKEIVPNEGVKVLMVVPVHRCFPSCRIWR